MQEVERVTTVEVPRHTLDTIIALFAAAAQQHRDFTPEVTAALRAVLDTDLPAGSRPGTVLIAAAHAWHLSNVGDSIDIFDLDEDDPATWLHPSVAAQQALDQALYDQAPEVANRLNAELEAA
jgi:hypothetical protein